MLHSSSATGIWEMARGQSPSIVAKKKLILDELSKASDHLPLGRLYLDRYQVPPSQLVGCENSSPNSHHGSASASSFDAPSHKAFLALLAFTSVFAALACVNPFLYLGIHVSYDVASPQIPFATHSSQESNFSTHKVQKSHERVIEEQNVRIKLYSVARTDRAGSAIHEMLRYHAEAYARNWTYGGACIDRIDWDVGFSKSNRTTLRNLTPLFLRKKKQKNLPSWNVFQRRNQQRKRLIEKLGLSKELPFACPTEQDLELGMAIFLDKKTVKRRDMNQRNSNERGGESGRLSSTFTEEWLQYIRSKRHTANEGGLLSSQRLRGQMADTQAAFQVVVHVRRGDVDLCHYSDRYLPNAYYLKALDAYLPPECASSHESHRPCNITIFSESSEVPNDNVDFAAFGEDRRLPSHEGAGYKESFEDFAQRGYHVDLDDSPLENFWARIMEADMVVLSRSSFSQVPAMMNIKKNATVIVPYFDFNASELSSTIEAQPQHLPQSPGWIYVEHEILRLALNLRDRLATACQK